MQPRRRPLVSTLAIMLLGLAPALAGCGGGGSGDRADSAAADTVAASDTAASDDPGGSDTWDISAADVDRYVRALEARNDSLRIESKRVQAIADRGERLKQYAQLAVPTTLLPAEVRASGMSEDRYLEVRGKLGDAYSALTGGADSATAATILARLRPDARQALERQVPRLKTLLAEADSLIFAAGGVTKVPGQ